MRSSDTPKTPKPYDPASRRFALARDLLQRNRRQDSLAVLESILVKSSTAEESRKNSSKVAALVGDYERKRGNFSSAANYYALATEKAKQDDARRRFRSVLGQVRALLSEPLANEAFDLAKVSLKRALEDNDKYNEETDITLRDLEAKRRIEISPKPLRPSVIASRLGEAFLQAGEWEMAEFFFNEALLVNPKGGCRARQALAKIALAGDKPLEAESRAHEALILGKYRAKTLSAWPLLITARARQKKPLLTPDDRRGLASVEAASVRARAVLVICKAVRVFDDTWMDLALEWTRADGAAFPAIRFELEKLMRSEARSAGLITREQASIALSHARASDAAPSEAIAAGKAYVRILLLTGAKDARWELVSSYLARRYGAAVSMRAVHAMALGAMEAKRYDIARSMLVKIRSAVPATRVQWLRSTWALARMEAVIGNNKAVYLTYSEVAQNAAASKRFRVQALLRALQAAKEAKIEVASGEIAWLTEVVAGETDHRTLLDLARQFAIAGESFAGLKNQAADRAEQIARIQLHDARHPAVAVELLLELNRRQFYDLGREDAVVSLFRSYAAERIEWLWSTKTSFWEWIGVVVHCIGRADDANAGKALAARYLNDTGTPPEGICILAAEVGRMLVRGGDYKHAFSYFEQAITAQPESRAAGIAHYWLAVRALAQKRTAEAKLEADRVRRCYRYRPALLEEWICDAQALLILNDSNTETALTTPGIPYDRQFLLKQTAGLADAINAVSS